MKTFTAIVTIIKMGTIRASYTARILFKLELTPQRLKTLLGGDKTDSVKLCPLCT